MLAIRMQRTGRKGHANFRVIVQDSRKSPSSGKIVALLGSYNPHSKTAAIEKERADFYLKNGAQPSDRVARLFRSEGMKLPAWVGAAETKGKATRNPEKLRKNRPEDAVTPNTKADEPPAENQVPAEETAEQTKSTAEISEEPAAPETKTKEEAKEPNESTTAAATEEQPEKEQTEARVKEGTDKEKTTNSAESAKS